MYSEIKVLGTEKIDGAEFIGIEGGFGEGKRSMLVRDIANVMNMRVADVNRRINDNRQRFNSNELLDLKTGASDAHVFNEVGFSKSQVGNAKNIYLLSERGYSKLLKIMDSDEAWIQYDKFVDGYFGMRSQLKQQLTPEEIVGQALQIEHDRANKLQAENIKMKPKVELHDKFIATAGAINLTAASKELNVKRNDLVDKLLNHGYIYRTKGHRGILQPMKKYVPKLFVLKSGGYNPDGIEFTPQMLITPYGREVIYKHFYAPDQTELDMEA